MRHMDTILQVKVVPGASRSRVAGRYGEGIKVQVAAAPEKGKANAAVAVVLAAWLEVPVKQVELVSGQSNPRKQFRICGLEGRLLAEKMAALR